MIPKAAVEAAWATAWDVSGRPACDITRNEMLLALEAAAPHMQAEWEVARKGRASVDINHAPAPGPQHWDFKCLRCDGLVKDHAPLWRRVAAWLGLTRGNAQ